MLIMSPGAGSSIALRPTMACIPGLSPLQGNRPDVRPMLASILLILATGLDPS